MPTAAKKAPARGANPSAAVSHLADVTDRMHGLLMERADTLMGGTENSQRRPTNVSAGRTAEFQRQGLTICRVIRKRGAAFGGAKQC